ncbi:MAG: hypothetical protein R3A79_17370 [Nannocystaceae bacterium]
MSTPLCSPWRGLAALALAGLVAGGCGDRTRAQTQKQAPVAAPAPAPASDAPSPAADAPSLTAPEGAAAKARARPPGEGAERAATGSKGQVTAEARAAAPTPADAGDEPRGDRFADLEVLCAALNKDYVDGTLTDYYGALKGKMTTAFGDDLRRRGEASMEPGRILEAARKTLGDAAGDPATPACDKLFDELDDLE